MEESVRSSRGGTVLPASSPLFKPDVRISRIRLTRIVSDTHMHRQWAAPRSQASDRRSWSARRVSQPPSRLGAWISVVGSPQAVLRASDEGINPVGGLRSTGVTPLPRYYAPLRLPTGPRGGYVFPPPVD